MKGKHRNSIRRKVAMRVVRALIVTVIALTVVNLIYMTRRVSEGQNNELVMGSVLASKDIDAWIADMKAITENMSDTLEARSSLDEKTIKLVINKVADAHPELIYVYAATEDGRMYMARGMGFAAGVDARQRGWYVKTKEARETTVIDPYISATTPDIMMATVATPIFFGGRFMGVVAVDAEVSVITELVQSIDYRDGAYGFIVDSQGRIVTHQNEEFLPTVKEMKIAKEVMPELADIIDNPGEGIVTAKDYSGKSMVCSTCKLDTCDWVVGMAYPKSMLNKVIDRGIRISIFVAVVCIILAAGDMTVAIRKILRPIDKINPAIDRIMEGDFTAQLDFTADDDEIGELQVKLAMLIKALSDIIDSEKYVLSEMEKGNLAVADLDTFQGDFNEIALSVNSIKASYNDIISDIQFSAINLQSYAMGINETSDIDEMKMIFEELSAEANALMDKTSRFITS